jgi:hypothetical protein
MKDSLFDTEITPLDVVKVLLLVVTSFSTWNIIDVMTPPGPLAWMRELAAVAVVEGAFLGFEFATSKSKNADQMRYATVGFFLSLAVIVLFALVSGFVEFAGEEMLGTTIGNWMGLDWMARDAVMLFALVVFSAWIAGLAGIYRLYAMADPDKKAELIRLQYEGDVVNRANTALKSALEMASPVIAVERAVVDIRNKYGHELSPTDMDAMTKSVREKLEREFNLKSHPESPRPTNNAPVKCMECRTCSAREPSLFCSDACERENASKVVARYQERMKALDQHVGGGVRQVPRPLPVAALGNGNGNGHKMASEVATPNELTFLGGDDEQIAGRGME